ncbi:MAG: hypothetical protein ACKV2O_24875 [Acidimicrobiales bacterium]
MALLDRDPGALRLGRFAPALLDAFAGHVEPMRSVARDVINAGDELAHPKVVGAALSYAAALGHFEEAHEMHDRLRDVLHRRGLPYTCDYAKMGHYGAINLWMDEGRLAEALTLLQPVLKPADATMMYSTAASAMNLACALGDQDLVEQVDGWIERDVPSGIRDVAYYVQGLAARARGSFDEAADYMARSLDHRAGVGSLKAASSNKHNTRISFRHRRTICTLLGGGHLEPARRFVELATVQIETLGSPPLPQATLAFTTALVHDADGLDAKTLEQAYDALASDHPGPRFCAPAGQHLGAHCLAEGPCRPGQGGRSSSRRNGSRT